jgi:hypothetical protein
MAIRIGERVELVAEGAWFEKFSWSRQLLDPGLPQDRGAPVFAIACTVVNLDHQAGVVVKAPMVAGMVRAESTKGSKYSSRGRMWSRFWKSVRRAGAPGGSGSCRFGAFANSRSQWTTSISLTSCSGPPRSSASRCG